MGGSIRVADVSKLLSFVSDTIAGKMRDKCLCFLGNRGGEGKSTLFEQLEMFDSITSLRIPEDMTIASILKHIRRGSNLLCLASDSPDLGVIKNLITDDSRHWNVLYITNVPPPAELLSWVEVVEFNR